MNAFVSTIEPNVGAEAHRLSDEIAERDIGARLIGGMAIRMLAGDRLHPTFERKIEDLDFVVAKRERDTLSALLTESGYQADEHFNALNGATRMLFLDPTNDRQVDIFVGGFRMCHELPLTERLAAMPATLPAAEVLMTKLQIVELNEKDRNDIYSLLLSHDVGAGDEGMINVERIIELTSDDWGLQKTFEVNFERLATGLPDVQLADSEKATISDRIALLLTAIAEAPKSRRWKLRARVGERRQWYEVPEEVDR